MNDYTEPMHFRITNEKEYESTKALWLECFEEDDRAFVDLYYAKRSRPEYVLAAFEDGSGEAVSMLHMIPVKMRFCGRAASVCLIAGVCTKPDRRRRGICAKLMYEAFGIMRGRGFEAAVLQPFDTAFYERFGFRTFIVRRKVTLEARAFEKLRKPAELIEARPEHLASLYSDYTGRFDGCTVRDANCFSYFIEEYSAEIARLSVSRNACCAGYAVPDEGAFIVSELFGKSGEELLSVLPEGFDKYVFPIPLWESVPEGGIAAYEDFSMIKPLSDSIRVEEERCFGFDMY